MGARSQVEVVDQPWPVVYDAFVQCLPTVGFRVTSVEPERGRIAVETRNTKVTVAVGAVDAITSEWVASAEQKFAVLPDRHDKQFARMRAALDRYLAAYY